MGVHTPLPALHTGELQVNINGYTGREGSGKRPIVHIHTHTHIHIHIHIHTCTHMHEHTRITSSRTVMTQHAHEPEQLALSVVSTGVSRSACLPSRSEVAKSPRQGREPRRGHNIWTVLQMLRAAASCCALAFTELAGVDSSGIASPRHYSCKHVPESAGGRQG